MENVKIALIIPPSEIKEHYGLLSRAAPELPPLGLAFIAKYLCLHNIEVDIYDFSVDRKKLPHFIKNISRYRIIGMPVYITSLSNVISFAKIIKNRNHKCRIVVGGPHACLFPEDLFIDDIDIVIKGEGEFPFYEVCSDISKNNSNLSLIRGIYFKKNGRFIYTGDKDLIDDLDNIDYPMVEKYNLSLYYPPVHIFGRKIIHTLTSRGCPYDCKFCAASQIFKRKVRFRSVDMVVDELIKYKSLGYDSVMFYDDSFTINRKRVVDLCKKIIYKKLNMKWMCFTRPDLVDSELLKYMKEAGCYLITFGCESGNDKTLELLNKKLTVEKNYKGIRLTSESGILAASSFMIGLPGEDYQDIERTIIFSKCSDLTYAFFPIFEPYKGTQIYDICKKQGIWVKDRRFGNYILEDQEEIWVPHNLTRSRIEEYAARAFKEFYFRNKIINTIINDVMRELPFSRKMKFFLSGIDYFVIRKFKNSSKRVGSRY